MSIPEVFCVPRTESGKIGYHEVIYAKDGDLNKAARQGKIRYFRKWSLAKKFARDKAKEWGIKPLIHPAS